MHGRLNIQSWIMHLKLIAKSGFNRTYVQNSVERLELNVKSRCDLFSRNFLSLYRLWAKAVQFRRKEKKKC